MTAARTRAVRTTLLSMTLALTLAPLGWSPAAAADAVPAPQTTATATFAGGCFWCMEPPFEKLPGVVSATSGYSGGPEKNPTYGQVSAGKTGHLESIQIVYDPKKIAYTKLLDVFWHNIDPTQGDGQFCDRGTQYRSAIFYSNATQRRLAEESKVAIEKSGRLIRPIVTPIIAFRAFYRAEEYHQDYYKKNPADYHAYRTGCGRDKRLQTLWGAEAAAHD